MTHFKCDNALDKVVNFDEGGIFYCCFIKYEGHHHSLFDSTLNNQITERQKFCRTPKKEMKNRGELKRRYIRQLSTINATNVLFRYKKVISFSPVAIQRTLACMKIFSFSYYAS